MRNYLLKNVSSRENAPERWLLCQCCAAFRHPEGFLYHCCSVRKDQLERKQKKCVQTVTHFSYTSIKLVVQIFSSIFPTYSSQLICFGHSCCVIPLMTACTVYVFIWNEHDGYIGMYSQCAMDIYTFTMGLPPLCHKERTTCCSSCSGNQRILKTSIITQQILLQALHFWTFKSFSN